MNVLPFGNSQTKISYFWLFDEKGTLIDSKKGELAEKEQSTENKNVSEKVVDQKTLDRRQSIKEKIDFLRDRINE